MGFNSVYRVLQEVFPQVDTRILRAVAIEHSKDADAAVEVVLVEVIPFLSKGTTASGSSSTKSVEESYHPGHTTLQVNEELISLGNREESNVEVGPDMTCQVTSITMVNENNADDDLNRVHVNTESEEISTLRDLSSVKGESDQGSHVTPTTSKNGDACMNGNICSDLLSNWEDFDEPATSDHNMVIHGESCKEQLCLDGDELELENSVVQLPPLHAQECTPDALEGSLQLSVVPSTLNSDYEKPEPSGTSSSASKNDASASEMVDFKDESALNTVVARSGKICGIDQLEDIIEDARNNKKTLSSAMESVIVLMGEVELQEKASEQGKGEAVGGGFDNLTRVEDLKQMLQHSKEANEMHAGEVYGEKSILAAEVRELQSRLLSLSDERDQSLAILDEMRQTLLEQMDAVEKERKAAEQVKMEKEEYARNALAEQELMMEKVVQESKILRQEAEENSKLREFLIDLGRVVDMLQGEISVICQDVKLLKEKLDERVPLSMSLSSSQTSCMLASSSSSLESIAPDQVPEQAESSKTPKKTSPTPSVDDQLSAGEEIARDDRKTLVDDGWELLDDCESYI